VYTVRLPNLAASAGHVQVTAWYDFWALCKVANWGPSGSDEIVNVRCYNRTGAAKDVLFSLTYVNQLNILGLSSGFDPDGHDSAYAWASQPGTASYPPSTNYQFDNFTNNAATGTRTATGTYGMTFGNSNLNVGDAQVTAYAGGTQFCGIAYWNAGAGIQVRCYALDGTPADSYYTIAFTGPFVIGRGNVIPGSCGHGPRGPRASAGASRPADAGRDAALSWPGRAGRSRCPPRSR